jgi:phosphoadenylyl-sulfate reductase (thioredoxin)
MTAAELQMMGHIAETWPAEDVLAWASEQFAPRLTLATGFGAEGCVLIDLVARHRLPVDLFTLDTGLLFPETYELWRTLEARYGVTIHNVHGAQTVAEQAVAHGEALWQREPAHCCELRKVTPLEGHLRGFDAWITAIRRDQTGARADARAIEWDGRFGLVKVNPLVRWTKAQVWAHLQAHDVPYNPLHDRGYPSIGCTPCTSAVRAGEDDRAGRWRGTTKSECGLHAR